MGIAKGSASLLYELKKDIGLSGTILQLGKQSLYVNADQLPSVAQQFGFEIDISGIARDENGEYISGTYDDTVFFSKLGFTTIRSLDASNYEGADIIHDLNRPIPDTLSGTFDFIYDGGTLEHVFDFPQCLKNIYDLLRVGGVIVHAQASHNHVDHGFYMYSPTVFWDYYNSNGFEILKSYIFEYERQHNPYTAKDWLIYKYEPGAIQHLDSGGWGRRQLGIWFVARKLEDSTSDVVPQQGIYLKTWEQVPIYNPYEKAQTQSQLLKYTKSKIRSIPLLGSTIFWVARMLRTFKSEHFRQPRPPTIARY